MIAPPIAGILYAKGRKMEFTGLAWFGAGIIAIFGIFQLFTIPRVIDDTTKIRSLARCFAVASINERSVQCFPPGTDASQKSQQACVIMMLRSLRHSRDDKLS